MPDDIRWIRSYVLARDDGIGRHGLHLPGVEPGGDPEHAEQAGLPVDEIIPVADTVIVRPDPVPAPA